MEINKSNSIKLIQHFREHCLAFLRKNDFIDSSDVYEITDDFIDMYRTGPKTYTAADLQREKLALLKEVHKELESYFYRDGVIEMEDAHKLISELKKRIQSEVE